MFISFLKLTFIIISLIQKSYTVKLYPNEKFSNQPVKRNNSQNINLIFDDYFPSSYNLFNLEFNYSDQGHEKKQQVRLEKTIKLWVIVSCMHDWLALGEEYVIDQVTQMVKNASDLFLEINISLSLDHIELPVDDECIIPFFKYSNRTIDLEDFARYVEKNSELFQGYDYIVLLVPFNYVVKYSKFLDPYGRLVTIPICYEKLPVANIIVHSKNQFVNHVRLIYFILDAIKFNSDAEEKDCPYDYCFINVSLAENLTSESRIGFSSNVINSLDKLYCTIGRLEHNDHKYCGNGIVDDDEECDCFTRVNCSNCCDKSTCTLIKEVECSSGICCNLDTCTVYSDNFICRPSIDDCDIEEQCDGESTKCPEDFVFSNGELCDDGNGYCVNGKCGSYKLACREWNSSITEDKCFEQNKEGSYKANCGPLPEPALNSKYNNTASVSFVRCDEEDEKCGTLWCSSRSPPLNINSILFEFTNHSECFSVFFFIIVNEESNPGHVPNGAPCKPNKLCLEQKCVPVTDIQRVFVVWSFELLFQSSLIVASIIFLVKFTE